VGCAGVELEIGGRRLVVDPYLRPADACDNYILLTHCDYDHCHEPTLERLVAGARFERMCAPPSCLVRSKLDTPVAGSRDLDFVDPARLTVMYPKYTREPGIEHPGRTEIELGGFHVETVDSSERPERYKPDSHTQWPDGDGPFVADTELPNVGYVISDTATRMTFYHPGDLGEVFDAHRRLRGRIDVMFFPGVKLQGFELTIIDAIRPRCVVPIHYRSGAPGFPIPLGVSQADLEVCDLASGAPVPGTDAVVWRDEVVTMIDAHWYPTPDPPLARLESLTPAIEALGTRVVVIDAGQRVALSALLRSSCA
jgi:L-ascorbate metabolism protein UlaG (beta-lactamase superfamily)